LIITSLKTKRNIFFSLLLVIPIIFILSIPPNIAFGFGVESPECYELGTCDFFESPFNTMILPYATVFGAYIFVLIWALIIGILWLRLGNAMIVGMIGLAIAALFMSPLDTDGDGNSDFTAFDGDAQLIGYVLLGIAITVVIYQILAVRTRYPSN
jgi:hypothetical protein